MIQQAIDFRDESDALFVDSLSEFIGGALGAGGVCVTVATAAHFQGLSDRLRGCGIDLAFATAKNRYIALEAEETLERFMRRGWPDKRLFFQALEPVFIQARTGLRRPESSVVAFGEMVAMLCEHAEFEAAVRLEELWNELARRHGISLRCAYPMSLFADEKQSAHYNRICAEHAEVIPAESYTSLTDSDRWRMVSSLQQQAYRARKLGQYQLHRKLGEGGMGEVYLGEHLLLKRACAIKLIHPEQAGDPMRDDYEIWEYGDLDGVDFGTRSGTLEDLADEPLILPRARSGFRKVIDDAFAAQGLTTRVAYEGDDFSIVQGLVEAGLGITLLPMPLPAPSTRVGVIPLRDPPIAPLLLKTGIFPILIA